MRRFTTQLVSRICCLAIGISIVIGGQQLFGQSVPTPPKKTAEMIKLEGYIKERTSYQKQIEDLIAKTSDKSRLLHDEIEGMKKLESKMSVSAESYPEVLKTLHSQRVQLLIDLAGIDARYQAIEKAIAQITKQQADSVVNPLQKLIEIRETELVRLQTMVKNGVVGTGELHDAEIALLEAKTRLAQVNSTAGGALGYLNAQLLDTSLEQAEKAARLAKASLLIEEVGAYRANASEINEKERQRNNLGIELHGLQQKLELVKNMIAQKKAELEELSNDPL